MDGYSEASTAVNGIKFSHGFDGRKYVWLMFLLCNSLINFTSTLCVCVRVRER